MTYQRLEILCHLPAHLFGRAAWQGWREGLEQSNSQAGFVLKNRNWTSGEQDCSTYGDMGFEFRALLAGLPVLCLVLEAFPLFL